MIQNNTNHIFIQILRSHRIFLIEFYIILLSTFFFKMYAIAEFFPTYKRYGKMQEDFRKHVYFFIFYCCSKLTLPRFKNKFLYMHWIWKNKFEFPVFFPGNKHYSILVLKDNTGNDRINAQ